MEVRLSRSDGKTLAELHRGAEVIGEARDDSTGELLVQVWAGAELLVRLGLSPN